MSRETQFPSSDTAERGERVRYTEALAVFEDMHRALKRRLAETPEHRALEGLDAALALVASSTHADHLDLDGFSAFRGSVELLNDNTPEARALDLFEGALRGMIASASDFDDLPDVDEEDDEDDQVAAANDSANDSDSETADAGEDTAVIVTIYDAGAEPAPAVDDAPAHEIIPDEPGHDADAPDATAEAPGVTDETSVEAEAEAEPVEIQQRIEELEAELAAARAHQAA